MQAGSGPGAKVSSGGTYAVQVASGGREPIVRRTDLGATGIYYRAMVGPFASMEKAAGICATH